MADMLQQTFFMNFQKENFCILTELSWKVVLKCQIKQHWFKQCFGTEQPLAESTDEPVDAKWSFLATMI